MGVTTNTCLSATAVDVLKLGYQVTLVEGCAKAFTRLLHDRTILTLTQKPHNINLCMLRDVFPRLDDDKQLRPLPVLYWVNGSIPSWRVIVALGWNKMPYVSKRLRVMTDPKETQSPQFELMNLGCKTPAFIDSDDTVVIESLALLQYLERFYPKNRPSNLYKADWTQESMRFHESVNLHNVYEPIEMLFDPEREKHGENIVKAYHGVLEELEHWERCMAEGRFLPVEGAFGLADCAFYPIFAYIVHRGLDLTSNYPGLEAYYRDCGAIMAVREACPDHWETPGKSLFLKCENMLKK